MNQIVKVPKGKTIFRRIVIPLTVIMIAQTLLLVASFAASGVFRRLRENERAILVKQAENRNSILETMMVSQWMNLSDLAETVNEATLQLLEEQAISLDTLSSSSDACMPILTAVSDELLETFRARKVSGIFLIFNTESLHENPEENGFGRRPGVYIRDMDPASSPSVRNEDLLFEYAPSALVRSMNIATDNEWATMFTFPETEKASDYAFLSYPFRTAFEDETKGDAADYGYWSVTPFTTATHDHTLAYTIPLILPDGTVYGVLGIDLTCEYLQYNAPYSELFDGTNGHYIMGRMRLATEEEQAPEELFLEVVTTNGDTPLVTEGSTLHLTRMADKEYAFLLGADEYYCAVTDFNLYSNNAPFENERWYFVGAVKKSLLNRFPDQVTIIISLIVGSTFLFGVITTFFFSRRISRSIRGLSGEVQTAQKVGAPLLTLSKTGIREIDVFAQAITALSRDRQEASLREQQLLEHERDYDLTTGLMNRRSFYRSAEALFRSSEAFRVAAIIMTDLDNLKSINDKFGHDVGDRYVYRTARCISKALPEDAVIGRLSGDEFLIMLYGENSKEEIERSISELLEELDNNLFELPDHTAVPISLSGGVAWYPQHSHNLEELVRMADFAMHQVKEHGKGKLETFDTDSFDRHTSFYRELEQLDELLRDPSLLHYHFQPIIDARDGSVHAYEALMRISLPLLRNPEEVLRLAHEERRLHEIEYMTWQRSFACYRDLLDLHQVESNAYIFINSIASEHLTEEESFRFTETNKDLLDKLVIEITEAENMDEVATDFKRNLPGWDGHFALDDYGSGYNSQRMLLALKPKYVKIDMSIIRDIDSSPDKQRIVSSIVEYAHERDMLIIAEGLETEEEVRCTLQLQVDLLQGYFLAKPSPVPSPLTPEAAALIASCSSP